MWQRFQFQRTVRPRLAPRINALKGEVGAAKKAFGQAHVARCVPKGGTARTARPGA
jgi:hypothetical protein